MFICGIYMNNIIDLIKGEFYKANKTTLIY